MSNQKVVHVKEPSKTLQEIEEIARRKVQTTAATDVISQEGHVPRLSVIGKDLDRARAKLSSSELSDIVSFRHRMQYVYETLGKIKREDNDKYSGPQSDEVAFAFLTKHLKGAEASELLHAKDVIATFADQSEDGGRDSMFVDDTEIIIAEDIVTKSGDNTRLLSTGQRTHARGWVDSMPSSNSGDYTFGNRLNYVYRILRNIEKEKKKKELLAQASGTQNNSPYDEYSAYDAIYYAKRQNQNLYMPSLGKAKM